MLELVDLLSNMPRIMLLLFKTNDLTRYTREGGVNGRALDESLHIESTERNFLLMTRYCAKAVFLDRISREGSWGKVGAWWEYFWTLGSVGVYGYWIEIKSWRLRDYMPRLLHAFWVSPTPQ